MRITRRFTNMLETITFQKRLFVRVQATDYPILEKFNMVKIIHSNISELYVHKLHRLSFEKNQIIKDMIEELYTDIEQEMYKWLNDFLMYVDEYDEIEAMIDLECDHPLYSFIHPAEGNKLLVVFTNIPDDETDMTIYENFCNDPTAKIDEYRNFMRLYVPSMIMQISKIIDILKKYKFEKKDELYRTFMPHKGKYEEFELESLLEDDKIIQCPYESYEMVLKFMEKCIRHPDLTTFYITIYRTAESSKVIDLLKMCLTEYPNKNLYVFIESTARGNEIANRKSIEELDDIGRSLFKNVVLYKNRYKTHCKMFLALSMNGHSYAHFSTGNYNEDSARVYTDFNLFTADPAKIVPGVEGILSSYMYNTLATSYISPISHPKAWFSPSSMKTMLYGLILSEMSKGQQGSIFVKVNNFDDQEIIEMLTKAATAECKVNIVVRTICGIRNNNLPPNIRITSYCGRFLQHDRVFVFGDRVFISSADLSFRNLHKRCECMIEINQSESKAFILRRMHNLLRLNNYRFDYEGYDEDTLESKWKMVNCIGDVERNTYR